MTAAIHQHHGHVGGIRRDAGRQGRALLLALVVTAGLAVAEVIGGLATGSLALLADAGHMVTDVAALALSVFATWAAARPSTRHKTYGYLRAEILAALLNGAALVLISLWIIWQALGRLSNAPAIDSGPMLLIAMGGLLANLAAGAILMRGGEGLNVRGALLHVAGDALGSIGAISAGAVVLLAGWRQADAVASILISALILLGAWRLLRESVDVLLEGAPHRIDVAELERAMLRVPGVATVHDLHVWTVTSGFVALSAHAELEAEHDAHDVLDALTETLTHDFDIDHVTIQPEPAAHTADCCDVPCEPGRVQTVLSSRVRTS